MVFRSTKPIVSRVIANLCGFCYSVCFGVFSLSEFGTRYATRPTQSFFGHFPSNHMAERRVIGYKESFWV